MKRLPREAGLKHAADINTGDKIATLRISGVVTVDGLIVGLREILEHPEWTDRFSIMLVYEPTALLGELDLEEVQLFQKWLTALQEKATRTHRIKSALVCTLDTKRVMLELHKLSFASNRLLDEQVFDNEADALAWLQKSSD